MDAGQLRTLLEQCELSQRGAAKALDINERTMRRYVSGKGSVPRAVELALLGMRKKDMTNEREKYKAIIADMAKLLELQQKSEGVVIDMIAVAVKAEREACAKLAGPHLGGEIAAAIRARGEQEQPR